MRREIKTWCLPTHNQATLLGIGDDAAVSLTPKYSMAICTDLTIENTHFHRAFSSWEDVGHKALTRALSNLAAMAALPMTATVSCLIPENWSEAETKGNLRQLYQGLVDTACESGCAIVSSDLSIAKGSPPFSISVTTTGELRHSSSFWRRSEVRPTDQIYVTGPLGGAHMALRLLSAGKRVDIPQINLKKYLRPQARLDVGALLGTCPISGAIDISEGLLANLTQVAESSLLRYQLMQEKIPLAKGATIEDALYGGEDYELILFIPDTWHLCDYAQNILQSLGAHWIGQMLAL